ncbi:MAG TPA: PAS domain S-box protein [Burkholderiales bacterium]|nr:PAS domain S-box protein [Burkholderiales bacterium]
MTTFATEQQTRAALLDNERRVLERIAGGAPLWEILETLVKLIEEQADGMRCAVLLADTMQQRLRFAAAPNIPEDYKAGIEPFLRIAPNMGSCGTAAFLRKPVYTKDTGVDALWEDCRDIAVRNGLRAIWSTPILSDDNAVLGTFAMYYGEPRLPSTDHIHLIDMATQMVRVAIEAKSNEELLRTVFEGAPCGMAITDLAGNIVRVNPTFARLVGHTQAELQGKTIADVTHEEDYPQNKALIDELLAGKREAFVIDKRYRRKDGQLVWVHNTVALVRGPADEPRYMVALIEDISARKRAAEASLQMAGEIQALARQKEDLLRLVIDTIPTMAWSLLPDGAVEFVNQRWLDYTGLSLEEALEDAIHIVHPEDLPSVMEKWSVDMAAGETCEYEMRLRRADGEYRWFLVRTVPLRDEQGKIVKWYGTSTDIEDRKRAEDALRESEEKFRQLAENIREVVWMTTPAMDELLYVSPAYEVIWARSRESLRQRPRSFMEAIHTKDREHVVGILERQREQGFEVEYRIVRPDGSVRWIRNRGFPIKNRSGKVYRIAGVAEDITQRKHAGDALRRSAAEHQALSRRLVELQESERRQLSRELHDRVGQNLTALRINLDILQTALASSGSGEVRARVDDSAALLESTMDTIENVMSELRPPMLDDHGLAAALDWHASKFSERTGIAVAVTGSEPAVRPAPQVEIALYRIAQEALNNVAKHARARHVEIALDHANGVCVMSVQDDGIGFDRVEATSDKPKPGLGMVTMRERAQAVGGRFEVQALPGRGTRLTVRVPR